MTSVKSIDELINIDDINDEELVSLFSLIHNIMSFNNKILEIKTQLQMFAFYTTENIKKLHDLVEETKTKFTEILDKRFSLESNLSMLYVESFVASKKMMEYSYDNYILNRNVLMWSRLIITNKFTIDIGAFINKYILELSTKIKKMFFENLELEKKLIQKQKYLDTAINENRV